MQCGMTMKIFEPCTNDSLHSRMHGWWTPFMMDTSLRHISRSCLRVGSLTCFSTTSEDGPFPLTRRAMNILP